MKKSFLLTLFCFLSLISAFGQEESRPFITTWDVPGEGSFTIPLSNNQTYNFEFYVIQDSDTLALGTHTNADGTFDFFSFDAITVQLHIYGQFPHFASYSKDLLLDVNQWGDIVWESMFKSFTDWQGETFSATDSPDLSNVSSMGSIFEEARFFNGDVSQWDVSHVTNMERAFRVANRFNQDISNWNVGAVTNMHTIFRQASDFDQDLSGWNISQVNSMFNMFFQSGISAINYDKLLNGWANLADSIGVINDVQLDAPNIPFCKSEESRNFLINNFDWDIRDGGKQCSSANNILSFSFFPLLVDANIDLENHLVQVYLPKNSDFTNIIPLIELSTNAEISPASGTSVDLSSPVTYTVTAFDGTEQEWTVEVLSRPFTTTWQVIAADETITIPTSTSDHFQYKWLKDGFEIETGFHNDVEDGDFITTFSEAGNYQLEILGHFTHFADYPKAKLLDVNQWGDIVWSSMESSFKDWPGAEFSAIDAPDLTNVTNMRNMFFNASNFNSPLNHWDVDNITMMRNLFSGASSFNHDLDNWNVSKVFDFESVFRNAIAFNGNVGNWQVNEATTTFLMFSDAENFNQDISNWQTSKVRDMRGMFALTREFNQDISQWNVSSVENMGGMFDQALNFNHDLSSWNIANVTNMAGMFNLSGLSPQNYDKTLIGWAVQEVQDNVILGVEGITFCKGAEARESLIDDHNWVITDANAFCSEETDILSFDFDESFFDTDINTSNHTVEAVVTFDTDVTSLAPFITLSTGAAITPNSEELVDFTDPVEYIVTAEDGVTTQTWTVTVPSQPSNDFCTGAIAVNVGDVVTGNTTFATNDANLVSNCGSNIVSNDDFDDGISLGVWYHLIGTGETITLNTCTGDKYDFDDTSMSVYTGSCSTGLDCLAGNEDAGIEGECGGNGYQSRLSFNSEVGVDYFILVDGYSNAKGEFDLSISSEPTLPAPANDNCKDAELLNLFSEGAGIATKGTNANSTAFTRLVECDEYATINDVWYTFNSGANTEVAIEIALTDTDEDGELVAAEFINYELYVDCEAEGLGFCGSDGNSTIGVTLNTDYWLQLWNTTDSEGTFTIQLNNGPNTAAELSFENAEANVLDISRFSETGTQIDSLNVNDAEGHAQLFSMISGNEEGVFSIDAESGAITVADAALLSFSNTTTFVLTIQSSDQGPGEVSSEIDLTINVIDNAAPVVSNEVVFIDENTPNGIIAATFEFSDPDGDNVIPISASTNPEGILNVLEDGSIEVLNQSLLDFEATPSIEVTFTVKDEGQLALKTTGTIIVNLNDINEAPIVADATFSISSFSENGFLVGNIPFTDKDAGQSHTYAILDDGDNEGAIFSIDATTGALTVQDQTQLLANEVYTFDVEVIDNGNAPLSGVATITVNTFSNNAPVITSATFIVDENTLNGSVVATLVATDADEDNVTFSLEDGTSVFAVGVNGEITVADSEVLDFENNLSFEIVVAATDDGAGTLKTTKTITIQLNDVNEVPVVSSATFNISSLSENGSNIGQVAAEDEDGDILSYTINLGNEDDIFTIDQTGSLKIANASLLNPITKPQHFLNVEVSDGVLTATAEITINVFLNSPPALNTLAFSIDENSNVGTVIGILEATDNNGIASYQITQGNENGIFELNQSTGELSALSEFNFEETQQYELEITVTDKGLGSLTSTRIITIDIYDVNEFDPAISEVQGGSVDENSAVGTITATVIASDEDTFQSLAYSISAGNEEGVFAINKEGQITTLSVLDFEQTSTYSLTVEVSDDVAPIRTINETVEITITNINEAPVFIAIADQEVSVTSELTFTATANDPEEDILTFSLDDASIQLGMSISANTGVFSWTPTSDQYGEFSTIITVSDGELSATESVILSVLNNETDILSFVLAEQTSAAVINTNNHTVTIEVAFETDLSNVAPNLNLSTGASSIPQEGEVVDLTNPVTYIITAQDGITTQEWTITAALASNTATDILTLSVSEQVGETVIDTENHTVTLSVPFETDRSVLSPEFTLSSGATSIRSSGDLVDLSSPFTFVITAEDGVTVQEWIVVAALALNTATDILTFTVHEEVGAVIDAESHTVILSVPFGTDRSVLSPEFTLSSGATSTPASGEVVDLSSPHTFVITAEDGVTAQEWTITAEIAPNTAADILSVTSISEIIDLTINDIAHTVTIVFAENTDLASVALQILVSQGATINVENNTNLDLSTAVNIIVTAEDGVSAQEWTIIGSKEAILSVENELPKIRYYPNPVQDVLHISNQTGASIYMLDMMGRVVMTEQKQQHISVDMRTFKPGVYMLYFSNSNNSSAYKIIKQ